MEVLADRVRLQVEGAPAALVDVTACRGGRARASTSACEVWLSAKATEVEAYADPRRPGTPANG